MHIHLIDSCVQKKEIIIIIISIDNNTYDISEEQLKCQKIYRKRIIYSITLHVYKPFMLTTFLIANKDSYVDSVCNDITHFRIQ